MTGTIKVKQRTSQAVQMDSRVPCKILDVDTTTAIRYSPANAGWPGSSGNLFGTTTGYSSASASIPGTASAIRP